MKIGIDISQLAFPATGVANYLMQLVLEMTMHDEKNEYVLFFSSLRRKLPDEFLEKISLRGNITLKQFFIPPSVLDMIWNRMHTIAIETFIGDIDIFVSSDWTEPPVRNAKKVTILYDLIVYKYPQETAEIIIQTQKRKLSWAKKECAVVFCISEATKNDAKTILGIADRKLAVIYPGLTL